VCAPLLLALLGPIKIVSITPYAPLHVQQYADMMAPDELMMSDIPWAVAWYGERPCAWLTLGAARPAEESGSARVDDSETFDELNRLKHVGAIFLTQRTSDRRLLSQMLNYEQDRNEDWSCFYLNSITNLGHGEVPSGFPLKKGLLDCVPDQMFISDRNRWGGR
jgi:hypothetical protein